MAYTNVQLSFDSGVATVTLNRPDKRNAINFALLKELLAVLDEVERSSALVVILTGAGKAFCAGLDLDELKNLLGKTHDENVQDSSRMAHIFRRIYDFSLPTIAAVNGAAIAGGTGFATLCDFTLAVPEAKFGYTEVHIGFIPALVSMFLERQVGEKLARDLFLTGRTVDAAEATAIGLVTRVVPTDQLLVSARELAATLVANSPGSLLATKRLLVRASQAEIDRRIELAVAESVAIRSTPDFHEGLAAFLEKRKPRWP